MPTDLGARFTNTFTGKPAHISPEDRVIFDRWWPSIKDHISAVYFDVGLGAGKPSQEFTPPAYKKMWTRLTQKRADVVITADNQVWIVELRFAANANAIGRLLTYQEAYNEDPVLGPLSGLMLVTNEHDDDVRRITNKLGIAYIIA